VIKNRELYSKIGRLPALWIIMPILDDTRIADMPMLGEIEGVK
jgi:hypothetical protein